MFTWLYEEGGLSEEEMARTFNCGLGAVLVVSPVDAPRVLLELQQQEEAWVVGSLVHKPLGEELDTIINFFFSFFCILCSEHICMTTVLLPTGAEPVVVRNLTQSLLHRGSSVATEPAARQNGSAKQKKTRVAVLISGTGEISEIKKYFSHVFYVFSCNGNKLRTNAKSDFLL